MYKEKTLLETQQTMTYTIYRTKRDLANCNRNVLQSQQHNGLVRLFLNRTEVSVHDGDLFVCSFFFFFVPCHFVLDRYQSILKTTIGISNFFTQMVDIRGRYIMQLVVMNNLLYRVHCGCFHFSKLVFHFLSNQDLIY